MLTIGHNIAVTPLTGAVRLEVTPKVGETFDDDPVTRDLSLSDARALVTALGWAITEAENTR